MSAARWALLRHRSLARDRLAMVKPQMRLEPSVEAEHRGTTSTVNIGQKPFVVTSKLYDWGHSWQRFSSLSLDMGLTTILTTIWVVH